MRLIEFVSYITEHPGDTQEKVASRFGVSARTVRKYVKQFNKLMDGCALITFKRGRGAQLDVADPELYEIRFKRLDDMFESGLPSNADDRVLYIVNDLLSRTTWLKLDDLADTLYVSRRTVSNDMGRVAAILDEYDIGLEERPYYGVRIIGTERAKRSCWVKIISEAPKLFQDILPIHVEDPIDQFGTIVSNSMDELDYHLSSVSFQNLVLYTLAATMRINGDQHLPLDDAEVTRARNCPEWALAYEISKRVSQLCGIQFPNQEIAALTLHISAQPMLNSGIREEYHSSTPNEADDIVSEMLEIVYRAFGYDFRDDNELRSELIRHVIPLGIRLNHQIQTLNPLLVEIKRRYPLAYAMATDSSCVLLKKYDIAPSDDEIGYIALAYALAIERGRIEERSKNVLLVSASGMGTLRLLEQNLRRSFGSMICKIELCDLLELEHRDLSGIDCIFTTDVLPPRLTVPSWQINPFLLEEDMHVVMKALLDIDQGSPMRFFDRSRFFTHLRFANKREAIEYLCDRMKESYPDDLNGEFTDSVMKREEAFSTALGNGLAMPHPSECTSNVTSVCVGLLDEPVRWDSRGHDVSIILLVAFSGRDLSEFDASIKVLARLFGESESMDDLIQNQQWEYFEELMEWAVADEEGGDDGGVIWTI